MICPACKGTKKQVIETILVTSIDDPSKNHKDTSREIDCFTCKGERTITEERKAQLDYERSLWCDCGNPSGDVKYYEDGEHPDCHKHCWTCLDCGKLLQVG